MAGRCRITVEHLTNERLVFRATLARYAGDTSQVIVATKGGHLRPGDGSWTVNGSPAHLKAPAKRR